MASGQTTHYDLNQWAAEDQVVREEFNGDNARIDAALNQLQSGSLHTAVGSYVGTGQHGQSAPNHLDFDFVPKVVILTINETAVLECGTVLIAGQTLSAGIGSSYMGSSAINLTVSWAGTGLSWYADNTATQLNEAGTTYFYFALG